MDQSFALSGFASVKLYCGNEGEVSWKVQVSKKPYKKEKVIIDLTIPEWEILADVLPHYKITAEKMKDEITKKSAPTVIQKIQQSLGAEYAFKLTLYKAPDERYYVTTALFQHEVVQGEIKPKKDGVRISLSYEELMALAEISNHVSTNISTGLVAMKSIHLFDGRDVKKVKSLVDDFWQGCRGGKCHFLLVKHDTVEE